MTSKPTPVAYFVEVGKNTSDEEVCMVFVVQPSADQIHHVRAQAAAFFKWCSHSKLERNKKYPGTIPALLSTATIEASAQRARRAGKVVARVKMGAAEYEIVVVEPEAI